MSRTPTNDSYMMSLTVRERTAPRRTWRRWPMLAGLAILAGCSAAEPPRPPFERTHPKPSLFEAPMPADGYQAPLPPLSTSHRSR